jgi:hypothetical protein
MLTQVLFRLHQFEILFLPSCSLCHETLRCPPLRIWLKCNRWLGLKYKVKFRKIVLPHTRHMCHVCMQHVRSLLNVCMCVCVCVRERERERIFAANLQVYSALNHAHRQKCHQNKVNIRIGILILMT